MEDFNKLFLIGGGIIGLGVVVVIGIFILSSIGEGVTTITSTPDAFNTTYTTPTTLTAEEGITSASVQVYNQTWLDFDGVDDNITIYNINSTFKNWESNFTLQIIFNPENLSCINNECILLSVNADASNKAFDIYYNHLGNLFYRYINQSGNSNDVYNITQFVNNQEYNILVSVNFNSSATFYFSNNSLRYSNDSESFSTYQKIFGNPTNIQIGLYRNVGGINGSINSLRIYNFSLNEAQAQSLTSNKQGDYYLNESLFSVGTSGYAHKWIEVNSTGTVFTLTNYGINKSEDNGVTWNNRVCDYCATSGLFIDSRGTIFSSYYNETATKSYLTLSASNDSNWTFVDVFECFGSSNASLRFQGMTEDNLGNLYLGEYTDGSTSDACGYLYKSTDGGYSWTLSLNSSSYGEYQRHSHLVMFDNYTNTLYASFEGLNLDNTKSRLFKSTDYGTTWTVVGTGKIYQFLVGEFTSSYRYFATDVGDSSLDGIYRTNDDLTFSKVLSVQTGDKVAFSSSTKDSLDRLYFGTMGVSTNPNQTNVIYFSDNGDDWYVLRYFGNGTIYQGFSSFSRFDNDGFSYYADDTLNRYARFNIATIIPTINLKLNENNGTTAYDSSGNSNDGTISGANWTTDGILNTLTSGVDYTLNTATGLLTMSSDYLYSWIEVGWEYDLNNDEGTAFETTSFFQAQLGQGGLAGWVPVVIAIMIGVLFLTYFITKKIQR